MPEEDGQRAAEEFAAAVGEDRREVGKAREVLLAVAGREPSDAAVIWEHGAQERSAASAGGVEIGQRPANIWKEGAGTETCRRSR